VRREALVTLVVVAGVALLVGLFFVFRSGSDEDQATPAATTTTAAATTEAATTTEAVTTTEAATTEEEPPAPRLEINVVDGKPEGGVQHLTANEGDRVTVHVTSDGVSDEVHLHGYDLSLDVAPGAPATITFEADIPGRFEIELEDAGTPIGELEVR
jgi:heme/copper-type cytochrome/quinol oxidase subunit 2